LIEKRKPMTMKVREGIKLIEDDGWYLVVTRGSHRQYKHPSKPGRITIAGHPGHDLTAGTLNSILKQAQLQRPEKGRSG
jgi:predicted RNA binding protein YcfA (HicA-like mRNA interferase family)